MTDPNRPESFDPYDDPSALSGFDKNDASDQAIRAQAAPENIAKNMNKNDPTSQPNWERATLEKLAFAALNEQKSTRRWKTFVRLAWLAFFIA